MPEITSVETIRMKLREFDERMDGAISAAEAISRIKIDAENILATSKIVNNYFSRQKKSQKQFDLNWKILKATGWH